MTTKSSYVGKQLTPSTAYAVVCGGTTTNGQPQSIASVGTSGQVLTSAGAGALPAFSSPFISSVSTPNGTGTANAMTVSGEVLKLSPATSSNPGIVTSGTQTFGGTKTFNGQVELLSYTLGTSLSLGQVDSSVTGSNADIVSSNLQFANILNLTNASLTSVKGMGIAYGDFVWLFNSTGATITFIHNSGGSLDTNSVGFYNPLGNNFQLANNQVMQFVVNYDITLSGASRNGAWVPVIPTGAATNAGTSGQVLVSNGATSLPSYQDYAPASSSFSPGFTGFSANPTVIASYQKMGRLCFIQIGTTVDGTSNTTGFTITGLPFTAASSSTVAFQLLGTGKDNGVVTTVMGSLSGTTMTICKGNSFTAASWTASGSKSANIIFFYETTT